MSAGNCSRLFLSSPPDLTLLDAFEGDTLDCSTLPAVRAKCRELVRADPLLLAGPTSEQCIPPGAAGSIIWIVSKKGYLTENAGIKQRLISAKIKLTRRMPVSFDLVLVCYQSTLTARLAPKWNIISDWIVRGSEIFETGRAQGLELDIGMNAKEITLSLRSYKLVINFLKPEDLNISTSLLNLFKTDPGCVINETAISNNYCYVLPKFTQAHVFAAKHSISQSAGFESYDKIRLYWKKQYGFILPESQSLFYQVFFKSNPNKFFSYPGCCIATSRPVVCPSRDVHLLTTAFMNDVHGRMPSICGQQIKFTNKPLTPLTVLQTVPQIGNMPNTRPAPVVRPSLHYGGKPIHGRPGYPFQQEPPQLVPGGARLTGSQVEGVVPCNPTYHTSSSCTTPSKGSYSRQPTEPRNEIGDRSLLKHGISNTPSSFLHQPHSSTIAQSHSGTMVPTFKSTTKPSSNKTPPPSLKAGILNVPTAGGNESNTKRPSSSSLTKLQPPSKRVCNDKNRPTSSSNRTSVSTRETSQEVPALDEELSCFTADASFEFSEVTSNRKKKPLNGSIMTDSHGKDLMKMLQKTKVPTLKVWLKKNGVSCTSKAKKEDLIRMVVQHLSDTGKQLDLPLS